MYLLYDLLLILSAFVLIPIYLLRGLRYGKSRRGIRERLGYFEPGHFDILKGKQVIWIHAVSVGETRAAIPLLKGLRAAYPDACILLSNVTETGHAIAEKINEIDQSLFFPFDLSWVVRRVLTQVSPDLVLIVETEIWPNFVRAARSLDIPLVMVNGRLSDRSFPRYRRMKFLVTPLLNSFSALCMQTAQDAERILELGARSGQVVNTGNLKFDLMARSVSEAEIATLRKAFCLPEGLPLFAAGSTHAGEEESVVRAFSALVAEGRELGLILVPRHPERCRQVAEILNQMKISFRLRSQLQPDLPPLESGQVLLVDTLGEMLNLYRLASLVFVGGSLVPVGGHNPLEASLVGKPVLFGPGMHNFKEISKLVLEVGGGLQVQDEADLCVCLRRMLSNDELRSQMGQAGLDLVARNTGATARTLEVLAPFLGKSDA